MSPAQSSVLVQFLLFSLFGICVALYPTQLIYEFPNGTFVENLAVRPDGSILTTLVTSPDLYLIQPSSANPNPQLIYRFAGSTSALGITEVSPDTFQVGVTNASGPGQAVPGTSKLYQVTFPRRHSNKAKVSLTANIPNITAPNGLLTLNKNKILIADSVKGLIFAVDLKTGKSRIAITDPLFAATERLPVGVNGIELRGNTLYFTTSAQNLLGKVDINLKTGTALGPATKIVNGLPPAVGYDDFALRDNAAYVASAAGNFIERVDLKSRQQTIVAGQINSTDIAEPTSTAFGRNGKENILFVTTGGGLFFPVNGDEIIGGQLVAVKLPKKN